MKAATSIGTDLRIDTILRFQFPKFRPRLPVVQGRPEAGSPAQGVGGGLHPLVDPGLDEVGVGDVGDHVIPVVGIVACPVDGTHLGSDA